MLLPLFLGAPLLFSTLLLQLFPAVAFEWPMLVATSSMAAAAAAALRAPATASSSAFLPK